MASMSDFRRIADDVRNWGRWGDADELGTLNLITAEKVQEAAALVRSGKVISLGGDFGSAGPQGAFQFRQNPTHVMTVDGGDAKTLAQVYNYEGIALETQASVKDQKKLGEAEAVFRKGIALDNDLAILHYNLGSTLMELNRDAEGIVEMKKYIALNPEGSKAEEAAKMIENPRRAREAYAPDVSMTTAEGEYITLEDLHGKVVLLDFWGTWCPPCVASVPAVRDLQKRFSKEPQFKMISVGVDETDEAKWRAFIDKNEMNWTQYNDRDHNVARLFDVHQYPTYILLDAEGIVRYREITSRWEHTGDLPEAIKKYLKLAGKNSTQ